MNVVLRSCDDLMNWGWGWRISGGVSLEIWASRRKLGWGGGCVRAGSMGLICGREGGRGVGTRVRRGGKWDGVCN